MKIFDEYCRICGGDENIQEHHINYKEDITIQLCRSCHTEVHNINGFRDDLEPHLTRNEAEKKGYVNGKPDKQYSVYIKSDDLVDRIEKKNRRGLRYRISILDRRCKKEFKAQLRNYIG